MKDPKDLTQCTRGALTLPFPLSLSLTRTLSQSLTLPHVGFVCPSAMHPGSSYSPSLSLTHNLSLSLTLPHTGSVCPPAPPRELTRPITSDSRKLPQKAPASSACPPSMQYRRHNYPIFSAAPYQRGRGGTDPALIGGLKFGTPAPPLTFHP